jgi:hypothetical protein
MGAEDESEGRALDEGTLKLLQNKGNDSISQFWIQIENSENSELKFQIPNTLQNVRWLYLRVVYDVFPY